MKKVKIKKNKLYVNSSVKKIKYNLHYFQSNALFIRLYKLYLNLTLCMEHKVHFNKRYFSSIK